MQTCVIGAYWMLQYTKPNVCIDHTVIVIAYGSAGNCTPPLQCTESTDDQNIRFSFLCVILVFWLGQFCLCQGLFFVSVQFHWLLCVWSLVQVQLISWKDLLLKPSVRKTLLILFTPLTPQRWIEDFRRGFVRGLGDSRPLAGSRGKAPVGSPTSSSS